MTDDTTDCAYCGCGVIDHDPVYVREGEETAETPFCNYGCLAVHVEEEGLAVGTTCSIEI